MKQCILEFLNAENISPIETQRRLRNVYGNRIVDVSTARRWVRRVSGGSEVDSFLDYTAVVEVERRIRSVLPLSSGQ
jgi:hypothetical protein